MYKQKFSLFCLTVLKNLLFIAALFIAGCSTYQTPGSGVSIGNISKEDKDIESLMKSEPAASFPARLAIARIQASGYYSRSAQCFGEGSYCVVTTRDIETEQDIERIRHLPMVADVAFINRLLLPAKLETIKDLRLAAAGLKADILLIYSIDTRFAVESTEIGPLGLISLGFVPNKNAQVTTTASAAFFDVRSGFVYGLAEATAREQQRATFWSSQDAIENSRLKTETRSFQNLLSEIEKFWVGIVKNHEHLKTKKSK